MYRDTEGQTQWLLIGIFIGICIICLLLLVLVVMGCSYNLRQRKEAKTAEVTILEMMSSDSRMNSIENTNASPDGQQPLDEGIGAGTGTTTTTKKVGVTPSGQPDLCGVERMRKREMVRMWLEDTVELPQYYPVFVQNGYESMDIIKEISNAEELKEIGVGIEAHRSHLHREIQKICALSINEHRVIPKQTPYLSH